MAIVAADVKKYTSVTAPGIGGAITAVEITDNVAHNIFDLVSGAESAAGDIEYRCFYVKNTHATLTLVGAKVWLSANASGDMQIGLGVAAINATEAAVADEDTAPVGVTFSLAATEGAALSIGDLAPGAYKAIWLERDITAGTGAASDVAATITFKGDTAA